MLFKDIRIAPGLTSTADDVPDVTLLWELVAAGRWDATERTSRRIGRSEALRQRLTHNIRPYILCHFGERAKWYSTPRVSSGTVSILITTLRYI
eukprot:SAG22_NODE_2821_length_2179_cov_1.881250_2_plen_94_part_00